MKQRNTTVTLVLAITLLILACGLPTPTPTVYTPDTPTPTDTPVTPTVDPTAGWPVYHNTVLGYSFKYPPDCFFGPMPAYCKADPPESRPPECLCFLDTTDPYRIIMQAYLGDPLQGLTLASFFLNHFETPLFNPPPGTDLLTLVQTEFSFVGEIPPATNYVLDGVPAVLVYFPGSPQAFPTNDIFVIHNDMLFRFNTVDVEVAVHQELYDNVLDSFEWTP